MRYFYSLILPMCLVSLCALKAHSQSTPTCDSQSCACWWLVVVDDHAAPHQPVLSSLNGATAALGTKVLLDARVVEGRPSCRGVVDVSMVDYARRFANDTATGSARIQIVHKNACSSCDQPSSASGTCAAWIAGSSAPTVTVSGSVSGKSSAYQRIGMEASFRALTGASASLAHSIALGTSMSSDAQQLGPTMPFIPLPIMLPPVPLNTPCTWVVTFDEETISEPIRTDQDWVTWEEVILFGSVTTSLSAMPFGSLAGFAKCRAQKASHNVEVDFGCRCSGVDHAQPIPSIDLGFTAGGTPAGTPAGGGSTSGGPPATPPLGPGPPRGTSRPFLWIGGTVPSGPTPLGASGEPASRTPMVPWYLKGSPYSFEGGRISLHRSKK